MTPLQRAILDQRNDGTVLSASPIRIERKTSPSRVVLRTSGNGYVVHMQGFDFNESGALENDFYYWGHYFATTDVDALMRAWEDFDRRTREIHGWIRNRKQRRNAARRKSMSHDGDAIRVDVD
jgi:hypothetical protein